MEIDKLFFVKFQLQNIHSEDFLKIYNYAIRCSKIGFRNLGLFGKKGLWFGKIKLSDSKIDFDKSTTITVNIKNKQEKFEKIVVTTKTDDEKNQYLKIDRPSILLPALEFPNRNTGDHTITITPFNIPLKKMQFKITVEVSANEQKKPMLKKEFSLMVNKK